MELVSLMASIWLSIGSFFGFGQPDHKPLPNNGHHVHEHDADHVHVNANEYTPPPSEQQSTGVRSVDQSGVAPTGQSSTGSSAGTGTVTEYADSNVTITTDGTYRYIVSNGIPNHETGIFPNPGNPNTISEQDHSFRVPLNPVYIGNQTIAHLPGVGLNGIPMEPGTAEREGNYNIEAFQDTYNLGLDYSNAHVQPDGTYHYHGIPAGYINTVPEDTDLVQVGWAADGFPMYVSQSNRYASGWELISVRSDGTTPDGTFTQDFEFTGTGDLDECNGTMIAGTYSYVLTEEFPYISRCLNGTPDSSFQRGPGTTGAAGQAGAAGSAPNTGNNAAPSGPPAEAQNSCVGQAVGSSCSFLAPHGTVSGSCINTEQGLACVPDDRFPGESGRPVLQ